MKKLSKEEMKRKFEDKFKDCKVLNIEGTKTSDAVLTVKHECGNIRDDIKYVNYTKKINSYKCICNSKRVSGMKRNHKEHYQKILDDKFGNKFTVMKVYKKDNATHFTGDVKFNKCGHIKSYIIADFVKRNSMKRCPICEGKTNKLTENELRQRIGKKFINKISYVKGYTGYQNTCVFKFNKCGHEFSVTPTHLLNRVDDISCIQCISDTSNKLSNRVITKYNEIRDSISPIYSIGKFNGRKFEVICKECNEIIGYVKDGKTDFVKSCECEKNHQFNIVENFIDINNNGKTSKLDKYVSINDVLDFQLNRIVQFDITKKFLNDIENINNENYKNLSHVKEVSLPYERVRIKFQERLKIEGRNNRIIEIDEINAFNVGIMNISTVIQVIYKTRLAELQSCYMFIKKVGNTITSINSYYDQCAMMKKACSIINYITNLDSKNKEIIHSYQNNNKYDTIDNNQVGVIEYKTLVKDTSKNYVYIKTVNISKRTIRANFKVAGHYRKYNNGKTRKKIFIKSFEKGKQFKNIRRIEKNYIIK